MTPTDIDIIETGSVTWRAVLRFIEREKQSAIDDLIADRNPEQARGSIHTLDKLAALAKPKSPRVVSDTY